MEVGIYRTPKFTAYIYPNKIIICTRIQCFKIVQDRYNEELINNFKLSILNGEFKRIDDFRNYGGRLIWLNCYKPQLQLMDSVL